MLQACPSECVRSATPGFRTRDSAFLFLNVDMAEAGNPRDAASDLLLDHLPWSLEGENLPQAEIGIIGGSGLYQMEALTNIEELSVDTPFGPPSDAFVIGTLAGLRVAFLPRHGRGHRLLPTEIPFRANIYAMKTLGVKRIISASAVRSLREELKPMDIVFPDQFFDRTRHRASTFFGEGIAAHVTFADPVCRDLCDTLEEAAR